MEFKISYADESFQFEFAITAKSRTPRVEAAIKQAMSLVPTLSPAGQVRLVASGPNKIQVIKAVRTVTNLGLREAKDLVERAPTTVKGVGPYEGDTAAILKCLLEAGAVAEAVTT